MKDIRTRLIEQARLARAMAYAPYSGYEVGAAVAATNGVIYWGCNVENASYGATLCAERVAVFTAVAAGQRSFSAIAVVTPGADPAPPCGMCLQVLSEFCDDLPVYLAAAGSERVIDTSLDVLFPSRFHLDRSL